MLVPMAAPFSVPVIEELPPRWHEMMRNGGPLTGVAPPSTYKRRARSATSGRPSNSAERSAMNLWLAP